MKKRSIVTAFVLGMATAILTSMLVVPGFAALVSKTINVHTGITLYYDQEKVVPKDANGKTVEPFLYDGTTYLPVRAVSNLLGAEVSWDGSDYSVYISKVPSGTTGDTPVVKPGDDDEEANPGVPQNQITYLGTTLAPYDSKRFETPATFQMDGKTYANGFTMPGGDAHAIFNLDGQYETLEFDLGHTNYVDTDKCVLVYLDGELAETIDVKAESMVRHVRISLDGAKQLKIAVQERAYLGFANAALR